MVKNKKVEYGYNECDICHNEVQFTVSIRTNISWHPGVSDTKYEYWCLKCLWNKLPTIGGPEEKPDTERKYEM